MRLTPLSRRRINDAFVALVMIFAASFCGVMIGVAIGLSIPRDYKCPTVDGVKPIVTVDGKDGQRCIFVKSTNTYGKATAEIKL